MKKFRVRLAVIFMVVIGCIVIVSGIFMANLFKQTHLGALKDSLTREIKLMISTIDWKNEADEAAMYAYYSDYAKRLKTEADARITIVREDGKVLGDSDHDPQTMDNHKERPEIAEAAASGIGSTIRKSDTLNENMLYVAIPLPKDKPLQGYVRLAISLKQVEVTTYRLWAYLIAGLLLLFVVAALISYRIAQGLTRPLEKITRVAHQIAHMNYKARVHIQNDDEIGQLGNAINAMADSLQLQMNRIKEDESRLKNVLENMISGIMMIGIDERIVLMNRSAEEILGFSSKELHGKRYGEAKLQYELTQMIQECMEQKEHIREELPFYFPEERMLEINLVPVFHDENDWAGVLVVLQDISAIRRLERMRSEFVANVSHELKTPIAAVKGFAETLLAGAVNDPETANTFLQIIYDESDRLNRLIGDILELSKIESKRIPLTFSPVEMKSFVTRVVEVMRAEAVRKQIQFDMQVEDQLYMEADEDRLRQILINLISNGINYTPEGGKVKVTVESLDAADIPGADADKVRITISDTGIGIPKKDLPRIFERFYRVDKARSRSSGGTGLGLSIVKHLVELHKGTIRVESTVGIGSKFIIELPVIH